MWLCIFSGRPFEDTFENSQRKKSNKCNQCDFASFLTGNLRTHLKTHSGEKLNKCDQCHFASSQETFENAQRRKVKQMQSMWLCIFPGRQFEETFENAQRRKAKRMQPMWLCIFSVRQFEENFENAQWRKVKQMQPMWMRKVKLKWHMETVKSFEYSMWI